MRVTPRHIDTLVEAFNLVLPATMPADVALKVFFRAHRKLGAGDRALIAETVFAALRRRRYLEAAAPNASPRQFAILALAKLGGVSGRELEPGIAPSEASFLRTLADTENIQRSIGERAEFPEWLVALLQTRMTDQQIVELGRVAQQSAPLDVRVNSLLVKRDDVQRALAASGIDAAPTPYSPYGLRLKGKPALNRHPLFLEGQIEVQDEGSQLLGLLVAPRRAEMVVDFCAGAGGKTLLLGALMHSQGRLYAFDVSQSRLDNLRARLKRSSLSNVHPVKIEHENDARVKRLGGKIDRVLVDAPCTGFGTLRRNPDLKWRQSPADLEELRAKQRAILNAAAKLLKPGGRLVYGTCSFLDEENENIVEPFLAAHADFKLVPATGVLRAQHVNVETGEYLRLSTGEHDTDAFFGAVMDRAK